MAENGWAPRRIERRRLFPPGTCSPQGFPPGTCYHDRQMAPSLLQDAYPVHRSPPDERGAEEWEVLSYPTFLSAALVASHCDSGGGWVMPLPLQRVHGAFLRTGRENET